jgi:hypothetical protein
VRRSTTLMPGIVSAKAVAQPLGEAAGEEVADHEYDFRVRQLFDHHRNGRFGDDGGRLFLLAVAGARLAWRPVRG